MRRFHVYIMTNKSGTLYTGVTSNLERRTWEHKQASEDGFTKRYAIGRLVYYEVLPTALDAIAREKQIKSWRRSKKIDLIRSMNPRWMDFASDWYEEQNAGGEGPDPSLRSG